MHTMTSKIRAKARLKHSNSEVIILLNIQILKLFKLKQVNETVEKLLVK